MYIYQNYRYCFFDGNEHIIDHDWLQIQIIAALWSLNRT